MDDVERKLKAMARTKVRKLPYYIVLDGSGTVERAATLAEAKRIANDRAKRYGDGLYMVQDEGGNSLYEVE